jgi:hypothetical protein
MTTRFKSAAHLPLPALLSVLGLLSMGGVLSGCGLLPAKQRKPDPVVARVLPRPRRAPTARFIRPGSRWSYSPISRRAVSATC